MLTPALPAGAGGGLTEVAPAIALASGKSRREIAFVPLLVFGSGALALIASQLLRPSDQTSGLATAVTLSLAAAAVVLCVAGLLAHRLVAGARPRTLFRGYTAAASVVLAGLTVIAAVDHGLATVAVGAAVLVAPSAGLALPARGSRITIVAIVTALLVVHAIRPQASALEAASVLGLVIAGWVVGLILRRGHRGASQDALLLSRGDQATGVLNRRGFIENVAYDLDRAARRGQPLLLVVVGLRDGLGAAIDGLPPDRDDALVDVAQTLARELPAGAALGCLGASKLGIVIPGGRSVDADWFAATARSAIDGRVTLFLGAACSPDGSAQLSELFDVAEAGLLEARRRSPQGIQLSEVSSGPGERRGKRVAVHRAPVSYERLRAAGGPPETVEPWGLDGQWIMGGFVTVALSGLLFLVGTVLERRDGLATTVVVYAGVPWILTALAMGYAYRNHPRSAGHPPLLPVLVSSGLVIGGAAVAALASGRGVLAPIVATLVLKAFFDGSTFDRRLARPLGASVLVAWAVVLVLGPASALWAAPFQAALLLGAFALGTVGHNAYEVATSGRLDLARTDPFTGLLDRGGFYERGEALLALGDPAGRTTFGVVLVDVEPLSPRVARAAPETGPRRTAAGVVAQHLRDASVVARFGSGDFRAIVRVESRAELEALVLQLRQQVAAASSVCRVGGALYGPDGVTLDALLAIASHRAVQDGRPLANAA